MRITVFTPAYNRGYIIEKLYRSLQRQTFRDFEWIVIDDGSTDDTPEKFARFLEETNDFPIRYIQIPNGGKHRAINRGVAMAEGALFFIVDSDDYLTDDALKIIDKVEKSLPASDTSFAGVCGSRGYTPEELIGSTFEGEFLDITMLDRDKHKISGDKAEVFYTEILKKYPFPEFPGENFLTECVVWDRIAADGYRLRFFNEIIYVCNYLPDGLSAHAGINLHKCPKGYGLYIYQCVHYGKWQGDAKRFAYLEYFYSFRDTLSFSQIASNLQQNPVTLYVRLFFQRVLLRIQWICQKK